MKVCKLLPMNNCQNKYIESLNSKINKWWPIKLFKIDHYSHLILQSTKQEKHLLDNKMKKELKSFFFLWTDFYFLLNFIKHYHFCLKLESQISFIYIGSMHGEKVMTKVLTISSWHIPWAVPVEYSHNSFNNVTKILLFVVYHHSAIDFDGWGALQWHATAICESKFLMFF